MLQEQEEQAGGAHLVKPLMVREERWATEGESLDPLVYM